MVRKQIEFRVSESEMEGMIGEFLGEDWAEDWADIHIESNPFGSRGKCVVFEATDPDHGVKRMGWSTVESELFDCLYDVEALTFWGGDLSPDTTRLDSQDVSEIFWSIAFE